MNYPLHPLAAALLFIALGAPLAAIAQNAPPSPNSAVQPAPAPTITLDTIVVTGSLDTQRDQIAPDLGATVYTISPSQIQTQSQGDNAPFNQTLLRAPGVAEDSFGQLHVRGEHANLQYRINDVLIPEGITGFGQELDTRLLDSVSLITGALPAQYGFHTAGIIDVHTKNGAFNPGGDFSLYGGSFDTLNPSIQYGGSSGKWNYYFTGSFLENGQGIENPVNSTNPIHDDSQRYSGFGYLEYVIDKTSRFSIILGGEEAQFQIPDSPGQTSHFALAGLPADPANPAVSAFNSATLNENQNEQNYYAIEAYQKSEDDISFQLSTFQRYSSVLFRPDETGDLVFNGVASRVDQSLFANGLQGDGSWVINAQHTLRGGVLLNIQSTDSQQDDNVFPVDAMGDVGTSPINVQDGSNRLGAEYGAYLQDEWRILPTVTINFGGRFDVVDAYDHENQLSPRLNIVWEATDDTTLHAGYARYFTPPPQQEDAPVDLNKFVGTTNEPEVLAQGPVKAERSDYFDAGITHQFRNLGGGTLSTGLDGYYKQAQNQLDDGQFGTAVILQPFNYEYGQVDGVEFTGNYQLRGIVDEKDSFNAYANFAVSQAFGENIISNQYEFSASDISYIGNHYIYLDHNQTYSGSFGASYSLWDTTVYTDLLYQSGLRRDIDSAPNGGSLPPFYPLNLGVSHRFHIPGLTDLTARFDVVNLLDQAYEIRDGTGVGVGAPQWGSRRGFFGGVTVAF
jgi:outer membrane receptor protein involved in Fe transport